jgi:hypothetical protein
MLRGYLTAIIVMILISSLWLLVQRLWGRQFPERTGTDGDALSGRGGCRGCTCGGSDCRDPSTHTTNSEAT